MHNSSSFYFINQRLHVSGIFIAIIGRYTVYIQQLVRVVLFSWLSVGQQYMCFSVDWLLVNSTCCAFQLTIGQQNVLCFSIDCLLSNNRCCAFQMTVWGQQTVNLKTQHVLLANRQSTEKHNTYCWTTVSQLKSTTHTVGQQTVNWKAQHILLANRQSTEKHNTNCWPTDSQMKSTTRTNCCIYTVYLLTMGYKHARNM
jgi:hypothetical protein